MVGLKGVYLSYKTFKFWIVVSVLSYGAKLPLAQQDAGLGGASPLSLRAGLRSRSLVRGIGVACIAPTRLDHYKVCTPCRSPSSRCSQVAPGAPAWRHSAGRGVSSPLLQPRVYVGDFKCGRISGFRCRPRPPKTGRWRMEWPDASSDAGCARRDAGAGKFSADAEQYNTRGEVL